MSLITIKEKAKVTNTVRRAEKKKTNAKKKKRELSYQKQKLATGE